MLLAGDSFDTGMNPEAWTMPACEPSAEVCVPTGEWDYPHDLGSIATANDQAEEEARRQAEMQVQMEAYASMAAATASVDVSLGMAASGVSDGFMSEYATTDPMASMSSDAAAHTADALHHESSPSPSSDDASSDLSSAATATGSDPGEGASQSPGSSVTYGVRWEGEWPSVTRIEEWPHYRLTTTTTYGDGVRTEVTTFWMDQSGIWEESSSFIQESYSEGRSSLVRRGSGTKIRTTSEATS